MLNKGVAASSSSLLNVLHSVQAVCQMWCN